MIEILEQHFPAEIAQRIFRYQSHPTADIIRELISRMEPYGVQELIEFAHYDKWNPCVDWTCRWSRKLYGCGCRICWGVRHARLSRPN